MMSTETLDIKPIETSYKGYKFRSRLEARWAVFFDAMGWQWEYEPEGYVLSDGSWYLPDFLINDGRGKAFVEVKPISILQNQHDFDLAIQKLSMLTGDKINSIFCIDNTGGILVIGVPDMSLHYIANESDYDAIMFCYEDYYRPSWASYNHADNRAFGLYYNPGDREYEKANRYHPIFLNAIDKAKSARFEHGVQG